MLAFLSTTLLLISVGTAIAEAPTPCCPPKQFLIRLDEVTTTADSGTIVTKELSVRKAYDATNELMTNIVYEYDATTGTSEETKTIYLFPQGAKYVIKNGKCTKEALPYQFLELCVPAAATYSKTFAIGLGEFSTDLFHLTLPQEGYNMVYGFSFTREKCIPYQFTVEKIKSDDGKTPSRGDGPVPLSRPFDQTPFSAGVGEQVSVSAQYFDYVEGIADPSYWFKPPAECKQAPTKQQKASAKKMVDNLMGLFRRADKKFVVY